MKHIFLLLLLCNIQINTEPITLAAAGAATLIGSTSTGMVIAATTTKIITAVVGFFAGWAIDKKIRTSQKEDQENIVAQTEQTIQKTQSKITKPSSQQNSPTQKEKTKQQTVQANPFCSNCAKNPTIECCAKNKSNNTGSKNKASVFAKRASPDRPKKSNHKNTQKTDKGEKTASGDEQPSDEPKCPPLEERKRLVRNWALKREFEKIHPAPFKNKGMPTYKKGSIYVTVDRDCHGGSIMKKFRGTKSKIKRVGSYDKNFNRLRD